MRTFSSKCLLKRAQLAAMNVLLVSSKNGGAFVLPHICMPFHRLSSSQLSTKDDWRRGRDLRIKDGCVLGVWLFYTSQ